MVKGIELEGVPHCRPYIKYVTLEREIENENALISNFLPSNSILNWGGSEKEAMPAVGRAEGTHTTKYEIKDENNLGVYNPPPRYAANMMW